MNNETEILGNIDEEYKALEIMIYKMYIRKP